MIKSLGPGLDSLDFLRIALGNQHLFIVIQNSNLSKPLVLTWPQLLQQIQNQINIVGGVSSVNGQTGVVVLSLDDLSDVNAPSPSVNQILQFNGTEWVPATVSTGVYTVDNGLTPDPFNINNFQLGGNLIKSTIISAGLTTANNRLQIDAPQNTDTTGSLYVTALNPGGTYTSSNNILANFQSNDIITAFFRTGSSYGGSGTGVYIQSTNALCTPIVIYGSGALGSGEIFKVTDNGQLVLEEYNSSTSFQGVSGTSQGVLNVDNTGKVFVSPASTSTGDSVSPFLLMGG